MLARAVVVIALVALSGCARRDFAGLCKLAQEILGEPRIEPGARLARFVSDAGNSAFGGDVRQLVATLPSMKPGERYGVVIAMAQEKGVANYRCPALEKVIGE